MIIVCPNCHEHCSVDADDIYQFRKIQCYHCDHRFILHTLKQVKPDKFHTVAGCNDCNWQAIVKREDLSSSYCEKCDSKAIEQYRSKRKKKKGHSSKQLRLNGVNPSEASVAKKSSVPFVTLLCFISVFLIVGILYILKQTNSQSVIFTEKKAANNKHENLDLAPIIYEEKETDEYGLKPVKKVESVQYELPNNSSVILDQNHKIDKLDQVYDFEKIHEEIFHELTTYAEVKEFNPEIPAEPDLRDWVYDNGEVKTAKNAALIVGNRLTVIDHFIEVGHPKLAEMLDFSTVLVMTSVYFLNKALATKIAEYYSLQFAIRLPDTVEHIKQEDIFRTIDVMYTRTNQSDKKVWFYKYIILHHKNINLADYSRLKLHIIYDKKRKYKEALYWQSKDLTSYCPPLIELSRLNASADF